VPLIPNRACPICRTLRRHELGTGPEQRRRRPPGRRGGGALSVAFFDGRAGAWEAWVFFARSETNVATIAGALQQHGEKNSALLHRANLLPDSRQPLRIQKQSFGSAPPEL
jgi:hypothetical protein